ncbi:rhamnan synthesis F family protein [Brevibacterium litoralis]|uniref:rhamnan synthesis F family protein n=1 Tax=Brevibacterium litoralis TaxID=3138935 RepID=UPI0032EF447A
MKTLCREADRFVIVSSTGITLEDQELLPEKVEYERRTGPGHRFACYQHGLGLVGYSALLEFDTVVLVDSALIGPIRTVDEIVNGPASVGYEIVPLTSSSTPLWHPDPSFIGLKAPVVRSWAFRRFWRDFDPSTDDVRSAHAAAAFESQLENTGFRTGAYFRLTQVDLDLAARRVVRAEEASGRSVDMEKKLRWDSGVVLADEMVRSGRLPAITMDVILHDPYALGADALLDAGERHLPEVFDGLREEIGRHPETRRTPVPAQTPEERDLEGLGYCTASTPR